MKKNYSYKLQGNGSHSWRCEEIFNGEVVNIYMIYEGDDAYLENKDLLISLIDNV